MNKSKAEEEWLQPETLGFEPIPNLDQVMFRLDSNATNMGGVAAQHVEKEKQSNRLDNLNLLYVTFTRPVQRLYVLAKHGKADNPNLLRDFLTAAPININKVSETDGASIYRFGEADFRNPKEKTTVEVVETTTDSVSGDWFQRISIDPEPSFLSDPISVG